MKGLCIFELFLFYLYKLKRYMPQTLKRNTTSSFLPQERGLPGQQCLIFLLSELFWGVVPDVSSYSPMSFYSSIQNTILQLRFIRTFIMMLAAGIIVFSVKLDLLRREKYISGNCYFELYHFHWRVYFGVKFWTREWFKLLRYVGNHCRAALPRENYNRACMYFENKTFFCSIQLNCEFIFTK